MELEDKKVLVVGLRRSGVAAAKFIADRGAAVTVTDRDGADKFEAEMGELSGFDIKFALGGHKIEDFCAADLVVVSPGVPLSIPPLDEARKAGVEVIGEVELAARFMDLPVVAVTGTNGKSTVTELIGAMMRASGIKTEVAGNIGTPLIGFVDNKDEAKAIVVEMSSFQLEAVKNFKPQVGVMLNITPDHLDRYADMESYAQAKARIWMNMGSQNWAVVNASDPMALDTLRGCNCRRLLFSLDSKPSEGQSRAWVEGKDLIVEFDGKSERISAADMKITGRHNLENALAASCAALLMGASAQGITAALETFPGLPHRTQFVREVGGAKFYDDSKGTNVGAVIKSLEGFDAPVVLIAGGLDKGGDFAPLRSLVAERVKALVLIGAATQKIEAVLGDLTDVKRASDMKQAVRIARSMAGQGDIVLLSPACASFDMFRDYIHRGNDFQEAVQELEG